MVGAAGIALLFASVVLMFQQFTIPHTPGETVAFQYNVLKVLASFVAAGVGMLLFARYVIGALPVLNRLILRETLASARVGSQPGEGVSGSSELVGKPGIALTPLRPAGKAEIGDRQFDVVTEGDFVEKGTPIEVVAVHGRQIVVRGRQGA